MVFPAGSLLGNVLWGEVDSGSCKNWGERLQYYMDTPELLLEFSREKASEGYILRSEGVL